MTQQIGNDDTRIAATINRAIGLDQNGQVSSAVELLARLVEQFPKAAGAHAYLAWFLLHTDRRAEAIEHGRTAVELAPNSEKASLIYFHALWKSGHQTEALNEMRRFTLIHPSDEYSNMAKDWKMDVH